MSFILSQDILWGYKPSVTEHSRYISPLICKQTQGVQVRSLSCEATQAVTVRDRMFAGDADPPANTKKLLGRLLNSPGPQAQGQINDWISSGK